jgi:OmpA-OmpF porin, OOP family
MIFKHLVPVSLTLVTFLTFGCAQNTQKVDLPSATHDEATRLKGDIHNAQLNHLDVLAYEEFKGAQKASDQAQNEIKDGKNNEKILEHLNQGRLFLREGHNLAKERRPILDGVIKTRQMAVTSGVRNYTKYETELGKIDEDLRDQVSNLGEMTPQDFSKLQSRYMDLELNTIKSNHLDKTSLMIETARNEHRAKKVAPKLLRQAELDLTNAQNMIAANRGKPENFKESVLKANAGAELLTDVIAAATKDDKNLDEDTALNLVLQNRKISNLQGKLGKAKLDNEKMGLTLEDQSKKMVVAGAALRLQKTIESARKSFTKQEAEVYQQGNKLLIRLKAMNFASGRADLPASSLTLLAKVKNVANELGASQIVIEGHTDSAGDATANDQLSQSRAEAVAHYLETSGIDVDKVRAIGYGFKKPIAGNKTKLGRAQNRRVDVIITPSQTDRRMAQED